MPNAEESAETAGTIGLFVGNLFPDRNIHEPRIKDKRPSRKDRAAPFSWKHFQRLIDDVNVSPVLVNAVIGGCHVLTYLKYYTKPVKPLEMNYKRLYLNPIGYQPENSTWQNVSGDSRLAAIQELEAKASFYIPLSAYVGVTIKYELLHNVDVPDHP
ncbi:hypothetical protein BCV72DRAFT_303245 [Rhizopus microsporus var. microsporus]|uniref:Uncharacterized protein n=2 Tax=Rhizopus microsporus TaxID=58291 RepID=A0A2G4SRE1_RHIZD|nr:uncharacterized protein RHIMIDRAFT_238767 [Rhizopus microsporus ATCC 52813]ORE08866.1 hypothetical protein BCV72DRAFT_303245 [Rhizopus microsporus var. microsporus]PHZ11333.1 hypothetical protein RHIMIDRAFT_238767 [Rhizopus microsporus ATCC 52813]